MSETYISSMVGNENENELTAFDGWLVGWSVGLAVEGGGVGFAQSTVSSKTP